MYLLVSTLVRLYPRFRNGWFQPPWDQCPCGNWMLEDPNLSTKLPDFLHIDFSMMCWTSLLIWIIHLVGWFKSMPLYEFQYHDQFSLIRLISWGMDLRFLVVMVIACTMLTISYVVPPGRSTGYEFPSIVKDSISKITGPHSVILPCISKMFGDVINYASIFTGSVLMSYSKFWSTWSG